MEANAREELARGHLDLVEKVVSVERRKLGRGVETDDLRSYAMEGLALAIDHFDPSREVKFASYAGPRIRGAIYDGLARADWLPRRLRRRISFYRRADEMLNARADQPPPADKVEAVHRLASTLKELATTYVTSYAAAEAEQLATEEEAEEELDRKRLRELVLVAIQELPPKQRKIVEQYFFEDRQQREIAEEMDITVSWVSKILTGALRDLRARIDPHPRRKKKRALS